MGHEERGHDRPCARRRGSHLRHPGDPTAMPDTRAVCTASMGGKLDNSAMYRIVRVSARDPYQSARNTWASEGRRPGGYEPPAVFVRPVWWVTARVLTVQAGVATERVRGQLVGPWCGARTVLRACCGASHWWFSATCSSADARCSSESDGQSCKALVLSFCFHFPF